MTHTGPCEAPDVVDVVALGESMVTFLPSQPGRLADVPSFERGIGGAESNAACAPAAAGHSVRWVSRVGADGFGDHLVEAIGGYGVDVSAVRRDPERPTGVYFRTAGDRATDAHEVAYYRAGSAASAMAAGNVDLGAVRAGRVLHLSGITAALSGGCLELLRELTTRRPGRPLISFDVNYRAGLWRHADGPRVLLELARGADVVFVGEDEVAEAWCVTGGPQAIREALPEPSVLVVKEGARGATVFGRGGGGGGVVVDADEAQPSGRPAHDARSSGWSETGAQSFGWAASDRAAPVQGAQLSGRPAPAHGDQPLGRPASAARSPGRPAPDEPAPAQDARSSGWSETGAQSFGWAASDRAASAEGAQSSGRSAPARGAQPTAQPAPGVRSSRPAVGSRAAGAASVPERDGTPTAPGHATVPRPDTSQLSIFVPALDIDVVATVGAGDAFAAGFLSATLRGLSMRDRLRDGHLWAAAALAAPGDLALPPARDHADRLVALDDIPWGRLRLGPGWTQAVVRADEEVRTP